MRLIIFSIIVFFSHATYSFSQVTATVYGDVVTIYDANFDWSCGGTFFPEKQIAGDTITITEVDTMQLTTCLCRHTVTSLISGLSAGSYTAIVFRQHRVRVRFPVDTIYISTHYAGSVSFTIGEHPYSSPTVVLHQSGCGAGPGEVVWGQPTIPITGSLESFPNPFNPSTVIRYTVPISGRMMLAVYDMTGQRVNILVNELKEAGTYEYTYDLRSISSGSYICRLTYGTTMLSVKLLLLK
ncbi:MAG: T9SS type A sorting domain-containing protein [Bacteriovoracaceae bacterium]